MKIKFPEMASDVYKPESLKTLPTLHKRYCCDCKIDTGSTRVWLCRIAGGVTIETREKGNWIRTNGDCNDTGTPKNPHAQALGRLGGKAGKGKSKARTPEQARAAVAVRWAKVKRMPPVVVPNKVGTCSNCGKVGVEVDHFGVCQACG